MKLSSQGSLVQDFNGFPVQGFSPDPDKLQEAVVMPDGTTWHIDVSDWVAILFSNTEIVQMYINQRDDATLTFPADDLHCIIINGKITEVTFTNNSGAAVTFEAWGM